MRKATKDQALAIKKKPVPFSEVVIYGKETVPEDGFKSRGRFA
jgi:hypothetical protein